MPNEIYFALGIVNKNLFRSGGMLTTLFLLTGMLTKDVLFLKTMNNYHLSLSTRLFKRSQMHAMYHLFAIMKFNHSTLLFVFTVSILAMQFPAILPAPVRMRSYNASAINNTNDSYSNVTQSQAVQSTVCIIQELKDALFNVTIDEEKISSCEPFSHSNMTMLLSKLVIFVNYAITEEIFNNLTTPEPANLTEEIFDNLTTPEPANLTEEIFDNLTTPANLLLYSISNTLPLIIERYVENGTLNNVDVLLDIDDGFNTCGVSEFCQENCSLCIANCNVHRLKKGVTDLIGLLEADFVSDCKVCVNDTITSKAVDIDSTLQSITHQLISPTPQNFFCVPIFLVQSSHCDQLLELQSRLEIISSWVMSNSDNLTNNDLFSQLQEVVETLNSTVLPETRKSLETLIEQNCTAMESYGNVTECEIISITGITESVTAQLMINNGCNMESSLVVYLRMINVLRFNYSHFIRLLQSDSLVLLS